MLTSVVLLHTSDSFWLNIFWWLLGLISLLTANCCSFFNLHPTSLIKKCLLLRLSKRLLLIVRFVHQCEQILEFLVDLYALNDSVYYFLLLQVFREPLQSQIPTITGSMGQRVSWCFWIGTSCEMAAGIGWLRWSDRIVFWRVRDRRGRVSAGAHCTLSSSGKTSCVPEHRAFF